MESKDRLPVAKEMNPVREPGPSQRRQKSARTGSLSSGYRWFESISLQRRVSCEPDAAGGEQAGDGLWLVVLAARTVGGLEEVDDAVCAAGSSSTLVPLDLRDFIKID
jgi:hypothetical protein